MTKLDAIKKILSEYCYPKLDGMSADEIARMILAIEIQDDDEDQAIQSK